MFAYQFTLWSTIEFASIGFPMANYVSLCPYPVAKVRGNGRYSLTSDPVHESRPTEQVRESMTKRGGGAVGAVVAGALLPAATRKASRIGI